MCVEDPFSEIQSQIRLVQTYGILVDPVYFLEEQSEPIIFFIILLIYLLLLFST